MGGGGGGFLAYQNFFFLAHFLCKNFFFGYTPMHDFFSYIDCNCIIIILKKRRCSRFDIVANI